MRCADVNGLRCRRQVKVTKMPYNDDAGATVQFTASLGVLHVLSLRQVGCATGRAA